MLAARKRAAVLVAVVAGSLAAPALGAKPQPKPLPPKQKLVVKIAKAQVGKPYVYGTAGPRSFDCSGFVDYVYRKIGVDFPGRLTTWTAKYLGRPVHGRLEPGDWIVTNSGGHMVLYVGSGSVIHAPRSGTLVQYAPVSRYLSGAQAIRRVLRLGRS